MAQGYDAQSAQHAPIASLYGAACRQSMVLSFDKLFLLAGHPVPARAAPARVPQIQPRRAYR